VREFAVAALKSYGYRVIETSSAHEALLAGPETLPSVFVSENLQATGIRRAQIPRSTAPPVPMLPSCRQSKDGDYGRIEPKRQPRYEPEESHLHPTVG
jgi:hypothetical protein